MNYCPQCGTKFEPGARFCEECGYDTHSDQPAIQSNPNPIEEPELILQGEPEVIPPPEPEVIQIPEPDQAPTIWTKEQATPQKVRKSRLWIVWVAAGVIALGAAGWFGYHKFFASSGVQPADSVAITPVPEKIIADTTSRDTVIAEPIKTAITEQPEVKKKPPVKTDKGITRPKAKETPKETAKEPAEPAKEAVTPAKETKTDPDVKTPTITPGNAIKIKTLVEVGMTKTPKDKNPKNPSKLVIQKPTMIVRITTNHYNSGQGTPSAGTLSIKDGEGNLIGTYTAAGITGENGIPNVKWVAEPNLVLEKGTYFIWDSDMPTWSKTLAGSGFIIVEGYDIK